MRNTDELAGKGGWKKRMPDCNGLDMGLNVTQCENRLTSNWSFVAREFVEFKL